MDKILDSQSVTSRAAIFCSLGCALAGLLTKLLQSYFSIAPFALWTLPFLVIVTFVARLVASPLSRLTLFWRFSVSIFLGFAMAYLWAWCPVIILGPFSANLGPVLPIWAIGSTSGFLAASRTPRSTSTSLELALLILLAIVVVFGTAPVLAWTTGYRDVTAEFIRWVPGQQSTIIEDPFNLLGEERRDQFMSLGLGGRLIVEGGGGGSGTGLPEVHMTVIMQRPLDQPVMLFFPITGDIIYIQGENGWRKVPSNSKTTQKGIELFQDSRVTAYIFESPGGQSIVRGIEWP